MNRKEQMTRVTGRVTTLVVAAFLTFGFGYAAEMITPVAVTAQSSYYVYPKLAAIDGSGLVPYSPVTATSLHGIKPTGEMWLSNGTLDTWITFDLGAVQSLTGFHLWNYNEAGDFSRRGVKTAGIYVGNSMPADGTPYASAGPAWGTLVENMTFTKASGAAGDAGADYAFANTVTGRYIQVYVTSSYGKDAYTGISEIRFYALTARSVDDQFVSPVTATAEQSWWGRRVPTATLNGSGMTPNAPVRVNSTAGNATEVGSMSNMWLNSVTNKTWITFDLGTIQKVTGFRVWNYNEHSGNPGLYTKSGVNRASLYVGNTLPPNGMAYASAGAAWGRWVQDFKFAKADGTPALTGADYALAMPLVGRYIQLYITDSFGNNSAGLSEIGFYTSTRYAAISPIAATAQSWYAAANDTRSPTKAVNGSGMIPNNPLTPASLAGTLASDMWLSLGTTNTWITFDLGAEQSIAGIHLWNYNEYSELSSSYSERGVKGAGLYVGDTLLADNTPYVNAGANWGTLVTNMTFAKADGLATEAGDHYTLAGAVTSRYVQIYVTSNYLKDNYTGISEIMFYTPMRDLTRLSSGDKVIENRATESVRVVEGTGTIGALTLGAAATSVNSLYVAATTEPVTVDLAGQTLALTKIEMQGDAGGLAIGSTSASGTLKSARTYLTVDNQSANPVTINAAIADGSGASSLTKSGRGVLILSEANTYSGNTTVNGGTLQLMGGSINTPAIDLNGGTLQLAAGSSATAVQLALNVGTGGLLNFDGGTLAVGSGAPVLDWIGAGNSISIADGGAVIDTANGSVAINRPLLAAGTSTGGLTKTGANTLTLTAPASYTGVTVVQGGTLKLVAPAPIIHYDFDTASISGTTLLNRGTGGAAYNGVIMGAPVTGGAGKSGEAFVFGATGQGVTTANNVNLGNNFTYAAWIKSNGSSSSSQRIINNDHVRGGYLGTGGDNKFACWIKWHGFGSTQASDDTANWHHVALVWDGQRAFFFYDGVAIQTNTFTGVNAAYNYKIGFGNNPAPNSEFWNGAMDEAYVFDRALTPGEVAALKELSWAELNQLAPASSLQLNNSATLELDGVSQTVTTLTLNGVLKARGECTWGAPGSGADYTSPQFTGTGVLRVLGPPPQETVIMVQ